MIQMPIGWGWDRLRVAALSIGSSRDEEYWPLQARQTAVPALRRIGLADLKLALAKGVQDFEANRTDVIFLCVMYPVVGLLLWRLASGYGFLHLLFPLASGFALLGPLAALGLYEMSRRRGLGLEVIPAREKIHPCPAPRSSCRPPEPVRGQAPVGIHDFPCCERQSLGRVAFARHDGGRDR